MGRSWILACALGLASACALLTAPAAIASFHLIKVREVYPGTADDSYVELQMYASGQTLLSGHSMTLYDSNGALTHTSTFSSSIANGQNQSTVLIGDTGVASKFGVTPDLIDSGLAVPAAGGAACWNAGGTPADCVAWGNFSGGATLQTATGTTVGTPASSGGIAAGKAIRRSIEPGCPTLLEEGDDTNSSAGDFSEVTPAPRNDSSTIVESTCAGAPNTAIDERPEPLTNATGAHFTYEAPTATSYECKLDAAAFSSCPSAGIEYTGLADGTHAFQVRGVNASGPDPTPASFSWRVDTVAPTTTIDQHPTDPAPGNSATFAFHASETGSRFECSLGKAADPPSFRACVSPKTYSTLADGIYTFAVRATDLAGNAQATATEFSWTVDNSLGDTTPPETTIIARPPDPSSSPTASFGYESNEPGSSFECSLDGAAFAVCPATGITYTGLADGLHAFQVRAVDSSANVDQTPAGYSFTVVLSPVPPAPPPAAPPAPPAAPQTVLDGKPAAKTRDRTPTFRFHSDLGDARFQCALDGARFSACRSPLTTKPLRFGPHAFAVRAVAAGVTDASPVRFQFKVLRRRR